MVLTTELKEMFEYIKTHPGVFHTELDIFGKDYSKKLNYLIENVLVEHIIKNGQKMNFFQISLDGEVYIETQAIHRRQKRQEIFIKLLDLIVPTITALVGVWLGSKLG